MYKANLEGIQACLARRMRPMIGWSALNLTAAQAEATKLATEYFEELFFEGTIDSYTLSVDVAQRDQQLGLMVEGACIFPEGCETNQLTFRTVVPSK